MSRREWGTLLVLCGAIFLEGIDVAMLNVALPVIRDDLDLSTGQLQWIVSAYVLGYGGFMLLGGRAADLFGRRRMFVGWLTVFLLFSGLGGLADDGWTLVAARFVTGVAAAFMAPAGLSVITTGFPEGPSRNRALLVYSGTAAGGFSLGLVLGGMLTSLGWRWVFFAPVGLSALILVGALTLLPRDADEPADRPARGSLARRLDLPGAFLVTSAALLLVVTVERSTHTAAGWTVATGALGLALLAAFAAVERRTPEPLLRLGLLRSAPLLRANAAALLLVGGFGAFQFTAVLWLQEWRGWSTMETSLALLIVGADAVLAPTLTPRLVNRFGNVRVVFAGLLAAAVGYALFLPVVGPDTAYLAMLPTLALIGVSFALSYGPLTIAATDGVDEREQGVAGALLYTFFQFGTALGLAVVTAVVLAATPESGPTADTYRAGMVVPLVAALLGALIMAVPALRRRPGAGRGEGSGENGGEGVAPAPAAGREAAAAGGAR